MLYRLSKRKILNKKKLFTILLLCLFSLLITAIYNTQLNYVENELTLTKTNFDVSSYKTKGQKVNDRSKGTSWKKSQLTLTEYETTKQFWRPNLKQQNSAQDFSFKKSFKFDDYSKDRIELQRAWMKYASTLDGFNELRPKKILVEGSFFLYREDGNLHCPEGAEGWETKCTLIEDRNKTIAKEGASAFDAIIEVRNYAAGKFERKLDNPNSTRQIIYTRETPYVSYPMDLNKNNAFLASYLRSSDLPIYYGRWFPFDKQKQEENLKLFNAAEKNYAEGKTKLAAIVVSNCRSANRRLKYVKQLQFYIPVDVFGRCGRRCKNPCFKNLKKDYKFYLSFENANCRDYITEKFFRNALENDMIPVVLGADKQDYIDAGPPNSFIHVEDFESPALLAEYLLKLDKDDSLYNEYFRWKPLGQFVNSLRDFWCRACALLFLADFQPVPVWPTKSTWGKLNACLPRGKWYWHRHV